MAGLVFAAAAGSGVVALARRPAADRPAGFCAMYLMALLFSLPIFAFRSPYAAVGGMTMAHGFQYLLLVGLVAAGNRRGTSRWLRLAVFANVALVGGVLLSGASHLHGFPPAIRLVFGAYLGVVTAHFVIDSGFWRMRDPFPRAFLARHVPGLVPPRALGWPRLAVVPTAGPGPPRPGSISGRRWIVRRYRVAFMAKKTEPRGGEKPRRAARQLRPLRRPGDPDPVEPGGWGEHGYALTKDIEAFADVRLAPGTLYEALGRLEGQGLIEAMESHDRRRPYRLTSLGAATLRAHLDAQRRVAELGLRRLAAGWGAA